MEMNTRTKKPLLRHLQCFDLNLPTNIYSTCVLHDRDFDYSEEEHNFVFVATSNSLFYMQHSPPPSSSTSPITSSHDSTFVSHLQMHEIPIHEARIPADTEIISISAFRRKRNTKKSSTTNTSTPTHVISSSLSSSSATATATTGMSSSVSVSSGLSHSLSNNSSSNTIGSNKSMSSTSVDGAISSTMITKSKSMSQINHTLSDSADDVIFLAVAIAQYLGEDCPPQCYLYFFKFTERELLTQSSSVVQSNVSASENRNNNMNHMSNHSGSNGGGGSSRALPLITQASGLAFEKNNYMKHFALNFVPLRLFRKTIAHEGSFETVFMASGSDKKVHIFGLSSYNPFQFAKIDSAKFKIDFLPSLAVLPGSALCIDMYESSTMHITAIGYQNGFLQLITKLKSGDGPPNLTLFLNGPISSVRLFRCRPGAIGSNRRRQHNMVSRTIDLINNSKTMDHDDVSLDATARIEEELSCINLAVGESIGRVTIFRNVEKMSLSDPLIIQPETPDQIEETDDDYGDTDSLQSFNSVLSVCVADVDADGLNEILVGTYSKSLLIYKINIDEEKDTVVSYRLARCMKFPGPVHSIKILDINKDGLDEVLVSTMYGVHVLQPHLEDCKNKVVQRLKAILAMQANNEQAITS